MAEDVKQEQEKQPDNRENDSGEKKTKEEELIHDLETITPKQLLEDLSKGNQASEQDIRAISEVMKKTGLSEPVMNVLIHYVLLQSNMKLSKAYLEKIASHWSRANLKTAGEAMAFAKKENERFKKIPKTNNQYTRSIQGKTLYEKITEAMDKGFTDEQLGFYVRSIINR